MKEHSKLSTMRPRDLARGGRTMERDVIRNEDQGPGSIPQHLLKKREVPFALDRVRLDRVAQGARGRDDGQDVIPPAPA